MISGFKTTIKGLALAGILSLAAAGQSAYAQEVAFPPLSTQQTVTQSLGLSSVKLSYARPSVRGRAIFGKLLPYGEVWRTGANAATTLAFDHDVQVQGKTLPAGTYALFTIPGASEWTVIFNKNTEQWGSGKYDSKDDALRITVKVEKLAKLQETLLISFENTDLFSATLAISWEKTRINIPLKVNQEAKLEADIQKAMASDGKKPYFRAARYYYDTGKDLKQALEWVTLADAESPMFYIKYWKALMQFDANDKAGAKTTAQEALKLAQEANAQDYVRSINDLLKKLK